MVSMREWFVNSNHYCNASPMSPECTKQLDRLGRALNRWDARVHGAWWLAAAAAWIAVLSLVDVLVAVGRFGRVLSALGLLALIGITLWRINRAMQQPFSRQGVAARIERSFPELDNHLINYLQFSGERDGNPLKAAYVEEGEPSWRSLDFGRMKDRRAHRRSGAALAGAMAAMALLWLSLGSAWGVAVWRMVNPFSSAEPVTLTRLLHVEPGDATVLEGDPLVIEATVDGFEGHAVKIDLDPADGEKKTIVLGTITTSREQRFSHRLPRVNANARYRIRAGDARPSEWYELTTRPPPAFTAVSVAMSPPAYTGRAKETFDGLAGHNTIYQGATIDLEVTCNTPLATLRVAMADGTSVPMKRAANDRDWRGSATVPGGHAFTLQAVDAYGMAFTEQVTYQLVPDRPPLLEITAPRGRVQLPAGQPPRIGFSVSDDYGLASAEVQEIAAGDADDAAGTIQRSWPLQNRLTDARVWVRDTALRSDAEVAYRVVVQDNCPFAPQRVRSLPLTFSTVRHGDSAKERNELEQKALAGLRRIIELQNTNIARTDAFRAALDRATREHWQETVTRQQTIRTTTRDLLGNPIKPFGGLTPTVKRLYLDEMAAAIDALDGIPGSPAEEQPSRAAAALGLQQRILRKLTYAETAAAEAGMERRMSGLSAMLHAMIREQTGVLKTTRGYVQNNAPVGIALVDTQDALAEDLTAFVDACGEEADAVRGNDETFAATLEDIASRCNSLKIRDHMILAAERLDQDVPADAIPFEERALKNLQAVQGAFDEVALKAEAEKRTEMAEALGQAKEKLKRVHDLHKRMRASMDAIRGQEDQSEGAIEAIEEAYEELVRNTRETVLEIPTDLHTFADMQAANELVEDVYSVFEEIEQPTAPGTTDDQEEPMLLDFVKEDKNLELMDEAIERIDEMETWLLPKPDNKRVTAEAFDREEMPEDGVAKGALAEEVQDLISDLLDEDQEQEDDAGDSATNHGVTDMDTGWGVEEGETVTYSAKGKSGNRTPDHKEQDGRSNVGRQGMAVGETAAASGTISKGDPDIEERRTEDPMQGGQIELAGEADTRATGGGKKGTGKADDFGMSGGVKRVDASEQGSWEGMAALMAKQADTLYAKASLKNVRVESLRRAAHHLRQAEDAIARGNIEQMKEFRRLAAGSLQRAKAQLEAGPSQAFDTGGGANIIDDVVEGGSDLAPPAYREQVADYYKALNELL